jgi:stearoyl-CoA 9-desaturase NADPH oxidoreductase
VGAPYRPTMSRLIAAPAHRLRRVAAALTTPLLPDDYLGYLNPLWSTREPRGVVDAVVPETADAATIWLRTARGWPEHAPGQYVRVGVDVDGVRHWRTYSLTSLPGRPDGRIAITVKALPDGLVSRQLVNRTRPGTVVRLAPPTGDYVLPDPPPRRVLFVTGGSGITPVAAMLRHLARRSARVDVVHVHLARTASDAIFGAELRRMVLGRAPRYTLHEYHDEAGARFRVDHLPGLVGDLAGWDTWACGPAGLLDTLTERWAALGISARLHLERFRPVVAAVSGEGGRVWFRASETAVDADGATPLLVAGEQAGALLPSGCRMGICHSCVGRLTAGAVRDLRTGQVQSAEGQLIRTCVSGAAGAVEIEL